MHGLNELEMLRKHHDKIKAAKRNMIPLVAITVVGAVIFMISDNIWIKGIAYVIYAPAVAVFFYRIADIVEAKKAIRDINKEFKKFADILLSPYNDSSKNEKDT